MNILLVENQYVIAVYDTCVNIYNASTGDLLQSDANIEGKNGPLKFKFKHAAVNVQTNANNTISDVYLLSSNQVEKKGTIQSDIYMMKEIGWEQ